MGPAAIAVEQDGLGLAHREHVGIVGAGAWGTALAMAAVRAGSAVTLWAHRAETAREINVHRTNRQYLPGFEIDTSITAVSDLASISSCALLVLAVPSAHLGEVCGRLAGAGSDKTVMCVAAKGLEKGTGRLMPDVVSRQAKCRNVTILSGPSFAAEVAAGLPCAVTVAGDQEDANRTAAALAGSAFRIYTSSDVTGVAIGGAVKNVIAIACGIAEGLGYGNNARAAVISRGLTEIMRLGAAVGARQETLTGLAGLGDLVPTCSSALSRNYAFGIALGKGETVSNLLSGRRSVVEGAAAAATLVRLARRRGVEMPISEAVDNVLAGRVATGAAISRLLARPAGREFS